MTSQQQVHLRLDGLVKEFNQSDADNTVRAVDHVDLDIYRGEFLTLLGPSGCGKTTTLRLIAGFENPTSGKILLDNKDVSNQPPNKRDMALVFQNYALFPHMNVADNVAYGLKMQHVKRDEIRRRVEQTLELMGLSKMGDRRPNQLSGGQQQRVALARSLIIEPSILLFDEPLSNLDAKLRVQMRSEIHRLQRRLGITSIYVTHDQIEAMALSDRVVVMNSGKIDQIGSPEEIYRTPTTRFVADFIGRANFVPLDEMRHDGQQAKVRLLGQSCEVKWRDALNGQTLVAMLRPEALTLRHDDNLPQVLIEQAMYLGSEIEYIVDTGQERLIVVENDPRTSKIYEEGTHIGLDFVQEAVHLLPS